MVKRELPTKDVTTSVAKLDANVTDPAVQIYNPLKSQIFLVFGPFSLIDPTLAQ
jgi:hypothetical protein